MGWLIAIDPGQLCGWFEVHSVRGGEPTAAPHHYELPWDEASDRLATSLVTPRTRPVEAVVCEKLSVSSRTAQAGNSAMWVPEFVGWARNLCRRADVEFVTYTASESKSFCPNWRLKALGWDPSPVGKGHARDATRLAVLWLARQGRLPTLPNAE